MDGSNEFRQLRVKVAGPLKSARVKVYCMYNCIFAILVILVLFLFVAVVIYAVAMTMSLSRITWEPP